MNGFTATLLALLIGAVFTLVILLARVSQRLEQVVRYLHDPEANQLPKALE